METPSLVLGCPTGRTPLELYRQLVAAHRAGKVSFSKAQLFALDEYVGLEREDPGSFASYLERHLFRHVDLPQSGRHVFDGAADPLDACAAHDAALRGGFGLLLLGIGENGHVAFNEPGESLQVATHVVKLSRETRLANAGAFGGEAMRVPLEAMTIGMGAVLAAREIVLLATGEKKRRAVETMMNGTVSTRCPASLLQLHPRVTVLTDF